MMTDSEIKKAEKELFDILKQKSTKKATESHDLLEDWLTRYGAYHRKAEAIEDGAVWWGEAVENAYRFLQTQMMLNACVSAKRSCFWAAVAAIAALVSIILNLCLN
jgi:hypothetical protein